jgi:membrane-associated phospholipid phosphatase
MFQAEPILWLQGLASPGLTAVLRGITLLGYAPVYVAIGLVLVFAARMRPALWALLALVLAAAATDALKTGVAFPRPSDVDARVVEPGGSPPTAVVPRGAATGFWDPPTAEAIAAFRARPEPSYGFPSGHVCGAAAFCLGLAAFFRWRGTVLLAACWPLLMGLSRMYLGRHFLGDVLGGLAVGGLAAAGAVLLRRWCRAPTAAPHGRRRTDLVAGLAVVLAVPTLWLPWFDPTIVGALVGLVLTLAVLERVGFPAEGGAWHRRGARVAGAALLFVAVSRVLDWGLGATGWEDVRWAALLAAVLTVAATFLGGAFIARRGRGAAA